jgi:hypothetical protein
MYRSLISLMPKTQPLLLDLFPSASVAYSLRKLRTDYTGNCIRVRRSSDNTEQDIGFVGNELDITSLLAFVGVNDGFITIWYDQSGNANHSTQTVALSQPQIVASGVVNTLISGKPCVVAVPSIMSMTNSITASQELTMYSVYEGRVAGQGSILIGNTGGGYLYAIGITGNYQTNIGGGSAFTFQQITELDNRILSVFRDNANLMTSYQQKTPLTNTTTRSGNTVYSRILGNSALFYGKYSEIIWWNGQNLITNQGDISDKINEYYAIY